jgi:Xaa-Pro aminopeptidase
MKRHFLPQFFIGNRHKLYEQLQPGSLLVLTAWTSMQRGLDQAYRFEQEPNFWYLTGVDWPDWLLLVDVDERREWLVAPHIAQVHQIFDGSLSADSATSISGVQQVVGKREGSKLLKDLVAKKKQVYTLLPQDLSFYDFHPNPAQQLLVRKLRGLKGAKVEDVRLTLSRLRAVKQPVELQAMQHAIDITVSGIKRVLAELPSLRNENEADAVLTAEIRRQGATHAFDPIIAAGANTTTMHHEIDATPLGKDDWLLLDVGARADHYCADISRTIPLGKVTDRQMELYESLRRDQQTILGLMQPGQEALAFMQEAEQVLHDSFVRLGLMDKGAGRENGVYRVMPHMLSHGLGYDVHDPLGRPDKLLPGMVMTAEIGLYIPEQGFGLRLEDDIVVTKDGPVNMSRALSTSLHELGVQ